MSKYLQTAPAYGAVRSQVILWSQCITDAEIASQFYIKFCSPQNHHQEIHQSWYEVPNDQAINAHDATDRIVGNVENCEDNIEEGEEKTHQKHYNNCYKHPFPNHVRLWVKTLYIDITSKL